MPKVMDISWQHFGRLLVIQRVANNQHGKSMWLCKCDCGKVNIVCGGDLKSGNVRSCGCSRIKHGRSQNDKTYKTWDSMIQRCTNPNHKYYKDYGGRGITVCKQWKKFQNFLKDMGEAPKGHQIDRINNSKGYYKENCHWVTSRQQQRNRRNNHLETYNGKTQCLTDWAQEFNILPNTLVVRISKLGWSFEKALTTSIKR